MVNLRKIKKSLKHAGILLLLGVLLSGLFVGLDLGQRVTQFLSKATGRKAKLVIDVDKKLGTMPRPWENLAQGGEETGGMMGKVVTPVKKLAPKYIRLDHIYDYYDVVNKDSGQLIFNWKKLDAEVEAILATGAKPFLALSYIPVGLGPSIVDPPHDWYDWQVIVRETVQHYSGTKSKNINNVYYEVWNEPDLFGGYKTYGDKNYLEMYRRSAIGASEAKNVNQFKLGGPATTGMYPAWIESLYIFCKDNNLKLDFVSWHRYSPDEKDFKTDLQNFNDIFERHPELALKERVISEWGFDPENNAGYDSDYASAHAVAVVREILGGVHKAFMFEIMDGKSPEGKPFWGRWGLMTHDSHGLQLKPRYYALEWLNELGTTRLHIDGEGSWVKAIAAENGKEIQIYIVNFDSYGNHSEAVPVTIKNLKPGKYTVMKEWLQGGVDQQQVTITSGTWVDQILMSTNKILRIKFLPDNS
ncbi:glycosyl hydrolase [Patescibacteria group bacterium]